MRIFFIDDKLENGKIHGFHHKIDGEYGFSRTADKVDLYRQLNLKAPIYTNCLSVLMLADDEDVYFWTGTKFESKNKLINKNCGDKCLFQMFIDGDIKHALRTDWRY